MFNNAGTRTMVQRLFSSSGTIAAGILIFPWDFFVDTYFTRNDASLLIKFVKRHGRFNTLTGGHDGTFVNISDGDDYAFVSAPELDDYRVC